MFHNFKLLVSYIYTKSVSLLDIPSLKVLEYLYASK